MARATKQFTINAAPLVLTIQLKRFEYVPFGRGKLNQFIEYPMHLDVSAAGPARYDKVRQTTERLGE
jgi:ubiquitin carboxyl-terminal hydrolase 36/42